MNNLSATVDQGPSSEKSLSADPQKSTSFLKEVRPAGPWYLQRFQPTPNIAYFGPRDQGKIVAAVRAKAGEGINLYWQINDLRSQPSSGKAALGSVAELSLLWVDLDPPQNKGMTPEEVQVYRDELHELLLDEARLTEMGLPGLPTFVIDSGGGYWGLWQLVDPEPVKDRDHAHHLGGHNKWIAKVFNAVLSASMADHCHNLDRVARLPGSVNFPDADKRACGRRPALAQVVRSGSELYPLAAFGWEDPGALSMTPEDLNAAIREPLPEVALGEGDALEALEPLREQYGLPETTVQRILFGEPLDGLSDEQADKTRSGNQKRVVDAMWYAGVPRAVAVKVLWDKRFAVADAAWRVRNNKNKAMINNGPAAAEREAKRQVIKIYDKHEKEAAEQRAADEVLAGPSSSEAEASSAGPEPSSDAPHAAPESGEGGDNGGVGTDNALRELNKNHAVLLQEGGKVKVLSWEHHQVYGRDIPVLQSVEDFQNRYRNRKVNIGSKAEPKFVKLGKWWLDHPRRREFLGMRLFPNDKREKVDGYMNLWKGFAIEPREGDWGLIKKHIHEVLAEGVAGYSSYIVRWMAWSVQNPDKPAEAAIAFQGGKGVGKGIVCNGFKRIWGQHGIYISSSQHLTGRFNSHMRDACFLFADEAIAPGDKQSESILKAMITEPELSIEGKGLDVKWTPNFLHVMMASNENWVVPATADERRFAVFKVSNRYQGNLPYFQELIDQMSNGGLGAMLHDLLAMDLGNWHPRKDIPQTEALAEQREHSLRGFDAVFLDLLKEGELPSEEQWENDRETPFVPTVYLERHAQDKLRGVSVSAQSIGKLLKDRLGFEQVKNARPRGYRFPTLSEARAAWDRVMGVSIWNDEDAWGERIFGSVGLARVARRHRNDSDNVVDLAVRCGMA